MPDKESEIQKFDPQHTLDFWLNERGDNKRPYIYDYKKSRSCDHARLEITARGGIVYECLDCNYVFHIVAAYQQPIHHEVIQSLFTVMRFVKKHGTPALQEVMRRPIGQMDDSPHKPVLPEGKSFLQTLALLDGIDTTVEDGGRKQLAQLLRDHWEDDGLKSLGEGEFERALSGGKDDPNPD